jgi:uncharacterized CHY-type Zn-finger protein
MQIDNETRCSHYHSELDIIAIKFKCCDMYYPCYFCHQEDADHSPIKWDKNEFDSPAILCGRCKKELTINEYMQSNAICPNCTSNFNPKCTNHFHFYFDI